MAPTFKLHLGVPGSSGALTVARTMGLPAPVIDRAQGLLGTAGVSIEDLLAKVAEQRRRLEEERAMQLAEVEALEAERAALRSERERQRASADKQARAAFGDAMVAIRQARREVDEVRAGLRRKAAEAKLEDVQHARRRLAHAAAVVAPHEPPRNLPPGKIAREADLVPGTPVIVKNVGRAVVASAAAQGKVEVRLGAMRSMVAVEDVLLDSHKQAGEKKKEKAPAPVAVPVPAAASTPHDKAGARTPDVTLDLRGERVDDAMVQVDRFLDEAMTTSRDIVFIVHGHGTGALRTAVRAHVQGHPAVSRWRAGEANEGGDGVTVLFLRD
jgi:DNA mismatch repair protein MutS2